MLRKGTMVLAERSVAPELLALLIDSVSEYAIFVLDESGHVASWNTGAEAINGYSAGEIIGRHFEVFYPELDRAAGRPAAEMDIAARTGVFKEQGWRVRADGSHFVADVVMTALHDSSGALRGFAKVTRDETERLAAVSDRQQLAAMERSEKVGAELADTVVRSLFRAGLELQGTLRLLHGAGTRSRVEAVIDELDTTIKHVRSVILNL